MLNSSRLAVLVALTLATQSTAQLTPVGYRDLLLPNRTGVGQANIPVRLFYPAKTTGPNTVMRQSPNVGWPVMVFLPGIGQIGNDYPSLANYLAGSGFVMVMLNSARGDIDGQRDNGTALFNALADNDKDTRSFFHRKLDLAHVALAGHSTGGGNVFRVLASNPGYSAGIAYAPWQGPLINGRGFPHWYAPHITVPILLVHGEGDPLAIWQLSSQVYFEQLTNRLGTKTFYLMGKACDHGNLISLLATHIPSAEVFFDSMSCTTGFLGGIFKQQTEDFEHVVGQTARNRLHTTKIELGVDVPLTWTTGEQKLGATVWVHTAAHEGPSTLLVAGKRGSVVTSFGMFLLDPNTAYVTYMCTIGNSRLAPAYKIEIPNQRQFIGVRLFGQSLSTVSGQQRRLSPVFVLDVK